MLLEELEMLRESSETSNMPQVRERKKDIKRICKELGINLVDGLGDKIQSSSWLLNKK